MAGYKKLTKEQVVELCGHDPARIRGLSSFDKDIQESIITGSESQKRYFGIPIENRDTPDEEIIQNLLKEVYKDVPGLFSWIVIRHMWILRHTDKLKVILQYHVMR